MGWSWVCGGMCRWRGSGGGGATWSIAKYKEKKGFLRMSDLITKTSPIWFIGGSTLVR